MGIATSFRRDFCFLCPIFAVETLSGEIQEIYAAKANEKAAKEGSDVAWIDSVEPLEEDE